MKIIIDIDPVTHKGVIDAREVPPEHFKVVCEVLCETYVAAAQFFLAHHKCDDPKCLVRSNHTEVLAAIISTRNLQQLK